MSAREMGLRYERLLFLAGPLSLVTLLLLFVAIAADHRAESSQANCWIAAANAIEESRNGLDSAWDEQRLRINARVGKSPAYRKAIIDVWIQARSPRNCFRSLIEMSDEELFKSPQLLVETFRKSAAVAMKSPVSMYGIEMPEIATISILGTQLKMELLTLTRALQVGLAPVLLLWLGSLYNTRQREAMYVSKMVDVKSLFPHIVNVYPVGNFPPIRKRSWLSFYFRQFVVWIAYPVIRIGLISVFVGPPVVFYLLSLYFMSIGEFNWVFLLIAIVVCSFGLANLIVELLPSHLAKHFIERNGG